MLAEPLIFRKRGEEELEEELEKVTTLKRDGVNKNQMALSLQ